MKRFSIPLVALFLLSAAICLTPQPTDASSSVSCSGEPKLAKPTPVRDFLAAKPVRKLGSVLKPKGAKDCSGN